MTSSDKAYTDEFKAQVVEEARNSTTGYPSVAEKYGIKPALVFEWVEARYPSPPAPFSSVHVWLGSTAQTTEAFYAYFAHAEDYWDIDWNTQDSSDFEEDVTGCPFCIDLGRKHLYDDDLIYIEHYPAPKPVAEVVGELPLSTQEAEAAILQACLQRGIVEANAVFSYADPLQEVHAPDRLFNGLVYLGLFSDERKKKKKK